MTAQALSPKHAQRHCFSRWRYQHLLPFNVDEQTVLGSSSAAAESRISAPAVSVWDGSALHHLPAFRRAHTAHTEKSALARGIYHIACTSPRSAPEHSMAHLPLHLCNARTLGTLHVITSGRVCAAVMRCTHPLELETAV